jgi:hypothetical protein
MCMHMYMCISIRQHTSAYVHGYQSTGGAETCRREELTYADVCRRMLTCAAGGRGGSETCKNVEVLMLYALCLMPYALCLHTGGRGGAETCRREEVKEAQTGEALNQGTPFYLLYWYKSTNTDADDAPRCC